MDKKAKFSETTELSSTFYVSNFKNSNPKMLLSTSRDPSARLVAFAKEIKHVIPNSHRVNRGNHVLQDLVEICKQNGFTHLILLHEHRGSPDGLIISHIPHGPTAFFTLKDVQLRHDLPIQKGNISGVYPHLIFNNFKSNIGGKFVKILKGIFPVSKEDSTRLCTFIAQKDSILFRHYDFENIKNEIDLKEIGPRFTMKPFEIRQGLITSTSSDREWVLKPYLNSSKKDFL